MKFPYVVNTRGTGAEFSRGVDEWLKERDLRLANIYGKGDFIHILNRVGENYTYAFKDPDLAMMFKLTWG